jgi:hypothetical protein
MRIVSIARVAAVLATLALCPRPAAADDLLGAYIGAGLGQSNVRDHSIGFDEHATAFEVTGGVRLLSLFGGELEYFDLGSPSASQGPASANVTARGVAGLGVLYLPIGVPLIDVYARAGLAQLHSTTSANSLALCPPAGCSAVGSDHNAGNFAWGVGGLVHLGNWSVRGDYFGVNASGGSQALISVGIQYHFL